MRFSTLLCITIAIGLLQAGTAWSSPATQPIAFLSGADSKVQERSYTRITTQDHWNKAWLAHLGLKSETYHRSLMEVDFDRFMMVSIFHGKAANSAGLRVESVVESGDRITVRFANRWYQTINHVDDVTPYGFVVLPRSDKPIVLEEDQHAVIGDPPRWVEVARLS